MNSHNHIYQISSFRINLFVLYVLLTNIYSLFLELLHSEIVHFQLRSSSLEFITSRYQMLWLSSIPSFKTLLKTYSCNKVYTFQEEGHTYTLVGIKEVSGVLYR